jgi:ferritin
MSTYHDIEQVMQHLSAQDTELVHLAKHLLAQDAELLRHAQLLMHLLEKNGISLEQLAVEGVTKSHLDAFIQAQSAEGK